MADAQLLNIRVGTASWSELEFVKEADEVHVAFNNNSRDFAPVAAERLRRKLGQGLKLPGKPRKQATFF